MTNPEWSIEEAAMVCEAFSERFDVEVIGAMKEGGRWLVALYPFDIYLDDFHWADTGDECFRERTPHISTEGWHCALCGHYDNLEGMNGEF